MKTFRTGRLALTTAGCFLGAGYVSGQELWKFFGTFGLAGFAGRAAALLIQLVFVGLLLRLGQQTGERSMARVLVPRGGRVSLALAGGLQVVFLFGVCCVMAAGAGALVQQLTGLPAAAGAAAFCLLATLFSFRGMDGLARICSVLVPGLIVATLVLSALVLARTGLRPVLAMPSAPSSPLLPNWWVTALTYVSYNILGAIGVLTPIGPAVPDRRTVWRGSALGVVLLLLISLCILSALGAQPEAAAAELPMLALAEGLHPALGWVYGALLLIGMLGTTVSFLVAIAIYLGQSAPTLEPRRRAVIVALAAAAFCGSLLGFGDLIGTVYPIFGYLGFFAMAALVVHALRLRREKKAG